MIALHSVSAILGRGGQQTLVLDEIDWVIRSRSDYVILGQRGSGKTTLLQVVSGTRVPTAGWVERNAVISMTTTQLIRYCGAMSTPRQLIGGLAQAYHADPSRIVSFVEEFSGLHEALNIPGRYLARQAREKIALALFYGLPCDYYLFDNVLAPRIAGMEDLCRAAFAERRRNAGTILTTSRPADVHGFSGTSGVLREGKIKFFSSFDEAIFEFEQIPVPSRHISEDSPVLHPTLDSDEERS